MPDQHNLLGWPAPRRSEAIVKFADDDGRALAAATHLHDLETLLTPTEAFYNVQHFGPPASIDPADFVLEVGGHVERPVELSLDDLQVLPGRSVRCLLECSGNGQDDFPLTSTDERVGDPLFAVGEVPDEAPPRLLEADESFASAGEFTGVSLADILDRAGVREGAVAVRLEGRDRGVPDAALHGIPEEIANVSPFNYDKALPLEKALDPDTLVAWAMNGESLSHIHGAPVRLVVPGWAANWSVKWIQRIEVINHPGECWYQTHYYYYASSLDDPGRVPITALPVRSIITHPSGRTVEFDRGSYVVRGLAWSGVAPINLVEISFDDGATWHETHLEEPRERWMWTRWSCVKDLAETGTFRILSRAVDEAGRVQPLVPTWNVLRKNFDGVVPVSVTVR